MLKPSSFMAVQTPFEFVFKHVSQIFAVSGLIESAYAPDVGETAPVRQNVGRAANHRSSLGLETARAGGEGAMESGK